MSLLCNEKNKIFAFLKKGYFPRAFFFIPLDQYLSTLENTACFVIASRTAYKSRKEVLQSALSFDETLDVFTPKGEPTEDDVKTCIERIRSRSKDPRFLLAFGGGSAMDLAKAVKYETGLTLLAVPTTPATGSEVTPFAVTVDEKKNKKVYSSHSILPDAVVLDPTLLATISDHVLGPMLFDILGHSIEALFSKMANPLSSIFASDALRLVRKNIEAAERPASFWEDIQLAGVLGGLAQGMASTGLCHAIAHYLGPRTDTSHSSMIALFLPDVFEINTAEAPRTKEVLARADESRGSIDGLFTSVQSRFAVLSERIMVPTGFTMEEAVTAISKDVCTLTNPFRPTNDQIGTLLKKHIDNAD